MQRILESRFFVPVEVCLYAVLAGIFFYVALSRTQGQIELLLVQWIPRTLGANFLLILIGLTLCRRDITEALRGLFVREESPASWRRCLPGPGVCLLLILITGVLLVSQVAPQTHRIYYDEDIYANMAQNIARTGQAGMANYATFEYGEYFVHWLQYNKDPSGWPFLVSLAFQLFGTDEVLMFYIANLLYAAGIVLAFFITRLVAGRTTAGLLAALLYALIPHNLIWSNTGAAEAPAAFFGSLTVLCALVWLRTGALRHLFLLAAVLPFACTLRPESALIGLWVIAALAVLDSSASTASPPGRRPLARREFWGMGLVAATFLVPHLWHLWAVSGHSWGAEGAKFSIRFFAKNLATNGPYYLDNAAFPALFTLLAVVGLIAGGGRQERDGAQAGSKGVLLILLWFVLFWGIFLFFYAGSYRYGADVRFALLSFMPIAVLAGIGGEALLERIGLGARRQTVAAALVLVLLFSWLKFMPLIRLVGQEAWGARYDHAHAREFIERIPERSVVVTQVPMMFLIWGQGAIQTYAGINNPDLIGDLIKRYGGHVYFHQGYWCNTSDDGNRRLCEGVRERYRLEPVKTAREQANEYGLYRMSFK